MCIRDRFVNHWSIPTSFVFIVIQAEYIIKKLKRKSEQHKTQKKYTQQLATEHVWKVLILFDSPLPIVALWDYTATSRLPAAFLAATVPVDKC